MPNTGLESRVAIVTGAGRGLGRAEATALAESGARVVVCDLDADAADAVVEAIRADGGIAVSHPADVSDFESAKALIERAIREWDRLDIIVNNAGILRDRMIFNMSSEDWDAVVRVHLRGHFAVTRWATSYWRSQAKQAGGPIYGRLINTASEAALFGSPGQPNYAAAKSGIIALTLSTAHACASYGVKANAICPRANTRMTAAGDDTVSQDPFGPDKVAPLVVYLSSPAADGFSGQVFVAYGGMVALLSSPSVAYRFDAPDGTWTVDGLDRSLSAAVTSNKDLTQGYVSTEIRALDDGSWRSRAR